MGLPREASPMDSVPENLVVLIRTDSGVFAVQRVCGELEYMRLRDYAEPCPLDQSGAIALLREG